MSKFKDLQSQHEELINSQASQDILARVQQYIEDVKSSSSQIPATRERDQLRANLRYWASYVYEKNGTYPNVELLPSTLAPQSNRGMFIIAGLIIVVLVLSAIGYFGFVLPKQAAQSAQLTAQAGLKTQIALTPTLAATGIATAFITATNTPEVIETVPSEEPTQAGSIAIQITSIQDGDRVSPITILSGNYSNLPGGYSIHVVIQPLSKGGVRFPMKQYALVSANNPSGEWVIEGRFGQGADLEKKEEYLVSVVAAIDQDARNRLIAAADTGFLELPSGVIQFPQTVSVSREAYATVIDGTRVIYSEYLDEEGNQEVYSMNPDGSDQQRITYTSGVSEQFPSLSPDGKQIVYAARKRDENNNPVYSIEVINSDGTSEKTIVEQQGNMIFEHPLWSSDGMYIAYSAGLPQENGLTYWNIHVYDVQNQKSTLLVGGDSTANRYFSWIPGTQDIVFDARMRATGTSGFVRINILTPSAESVFYDGEGEELQPAVSPDGSHLAYMQLDNGAGNIYVVDLGTGEITQLTTSGYQESYPVWDPDGQTIYFESFETDYVTVWSVRIDGSNLTQLTNGKDRYPYAGYMYALIPGQP